MALDQRKLAEVRAHEEFLAQASHPNARKPFGPDWGVDYWVKWATIMDILIRLGIQPGARVLDAGCGPGWTSVFLAESGYETTAFDIAPAAIEMAAARADHRGLHIDFRVADMEAGLGTDERFDVVLVFDCLHHSDHPERVVNALADHLAPGGWIIFGEPSWLHTISPHARKTSRELGWRELGVRVRWLRQTCEAAGLREVRRFFEGTRPYESRVKGIAWQLIRLVAANVAAAAPQASVWVAAQRPEAPLSGR